MNSLFLTLINLLAVCPLIAQVEFDRHIQLTGPDGERKITGIELPINDFDAVNKAYVDNALSGGGAHYVGEFFGGGIVFAVWNEGVEQHGLICATQDVSASHIYSNQNTLLIGSSAQSETKGAANSAAITSQAGHTSSAAQLCTAFSGGGFSDWYLPARYEIELIRGNLALIQFLLNDDGDPSTIPISGGTFWSSTELGNDVAFSYNITGGSQQLGFKNLTYRVRPVRRF